MGMAGIAGAMMICNNMGINPLQSTSQEKMEAWMMLAIMASPFIAHLIAKGFQALIRLFW